MTANGSVPVLMKIFTQSLVKELQYYIKEKTDNEAEEEKKSLFSKSDIERTDTHFQAAVC